MADEELFPLDKGQAEQPQEEVKPDEKPEVKAENPPEPQVPLSALKEVRGENRTLKQRLSDIEVLLLERNRQPTPDPIADPEAHSAYLMHEMQRIQANTIAEMSERFARDKHGDEFMDEALDAAKAAGVVDRLRQSRDPWGDLAKWHKAEKAKAEIGDDPEAYKARLKAELLAELKSETAGRSVSPPASLAGQPNLATSAPAWGGPTPLNELFGTDKKGF